MSEQVDANAITTVESGGRTLSGAGVSAEKLQETIDDHEDRHTPAEKSVDSALVPSGSATVAEGQPKQTRGQARFSELTEQRKAAEVKAEAAEKKAADLEARLSQQQQHPVPRSAEKQSSEVALTGQSGTTSPQPTRQKPSEDDIGDKYPTYADFVEDLSGWKTEQRMAAFDMRGSIRQQLEAEREAQTFNAHVEATRTKGRAAYRDFDQMLKSGPGTFVDMPMPAVHAILNHPQSEHLQYQVMKDKALAERLAGLAFQNPYAFAFELAKLAPAEQPTNGGRPQPAPPAPMQPVGSGSRSSTPNSAEHAEKGDYPAYKAARTAERKRR